MNNSERFVVYPPEENKAGLAVSYNEQPGPHGTKFTVDQLWEPGPDEESGRAEPVYVGDELRVAELIETLSQALQVDQEIRFNSGGRR